MLNKVLAAFVLILMMSAIADAQFTMIRGYVIAPSKKHIDEFDVLLTYKDTDEVVGQTYVNAMGAFMFTNVNLSMGPFDILVRLDGFRESRTPIFNTRYFTGMSDLPMIGENIILIPDPRSQAIADEYAAYSKALLDEYAEGLDEVSSQHPELAVTHLEKVVRGVPDFYDAHISLGVVYEKLSRMNEAEREFRKASELNTDSARPLVMLGKLFVEEAELELFSDSKRDGVSMKLAQAREVLEQALSLDEKYAKTYYLLGAVDFRSASYSDAEMKLKHALELEPTLFEAQIVLVNVYLAKMMLQDALDSVDLFILQNPGSPYRQQALDARLGIIRRLQLRL